ncbi:MAG: hypothetical protein MZV70_63145 [Desulfobacterales bacterium]|nr:hypothetical protein [Desulfobacterales bacterium]
MSIGSICARSAAAAPAAADRAAAALAGRRRRAVRAACARFGLAEFFLQPIDRRGDRAGVRLT